MTETTDAADAEQRGFRKGFSIGLLSFAIPTALWGAYRAIFEFPAFEAVFRQVKMPMPGLFLLVMNTHVVMAGLLVAGSLACIALTKLGMDSRKTVRINLALLLVSVGWLGLFSLAVQGPLLGVLESLGGRR